MKKDIKEYVKSCEPCQLCKALPNKNCGHQKLFSCTYPNEMVAVDLAQMPTSRRGNTYLVGIVDRFSRFIQLVPIPDKEAETVAKAVYVHWIAMFGPPTSMLSDRGAEFTAAIYQHLLKKHGIHQKFTTPYHPQTDGMIERRFRYIKERIRILGEQMGLNLLDRDSSIWDDLIHGVKYSFNTTTNRMLGYSPFEIFLSHTPKLSIDIGLELRHAHDELESSDNQDQAVKTYLDWIKPRYAQILNDAIGRQERYDEQRKRYAHRRQQQPKFVKGESVMLYVGNRMSAFSTERKLTPHWRKGFTVVDVSDDKNTVEMTHESDDSDKPHRFKYHVSNIRHYHEREEYKISEDRKRVMYDDTDSDIDESEDGDEEEKAHEEVELFDNHETSNQGPSHSYVDDDGDVEIHEAYEAPASQHAHDHGTYVQRPEIIESQEVSATAVRGTQQKSFIDQAVANALPNVPALGPATYPRNFVGNKGNPLPSGTIADIKHHALEQFTTPHIVGAVSDTHSELPEIPSKGGLEAVNQSSAKPLELPSLDRVFEEQDSGTQDAQGLQVPDAQQEVKQLDDAQHLHLYRDMERKREPRTSQYDQLKKFKHGKFQRRARTKKFRHFKVKLSEWFSGGKSSKDL